MHTASDPDYYAGIVSRPSFLRQTGSLTIKSNYVRWLRSTLFLALVLRSP